MAKSIDSYPWDVLVPLLVKHAPSDANVLFWGPPGTGKSHTARTLVRKGGAMAVIPCHPGLDSLDLLGTQWPNQDTGRLEFVTSPALNAWSTPGGVVVFDELHRLIGSDAEPILHAFGDSEAVARIDLPDGRTFRRAANVTVVGTSNDGPDALPEAVASRFAIRLHANTPHPKLLATFENVPGLRAAVEGSYADPENALIDTRAARVYAHAIETGAPSELAAILAVGGERASALIKALRAAS